MTELMIIQDSLCRPTAFFWNGAIDAARLRAWLHRNGLEAKCPNDLVRLWQVTGGGNFFESETILGPYGDAQMGDDFLGANEHLRARGLPPRFLAFSTGMSIGAVDVSTGEFVELGNEGLDVRCRYVSLDHWYSSTVRDELGARYGLA